jgi:hypothetical protein
MGFNALVGTATSGGLRSWFDNVCGRSARKGAEEALSKSRDASTRASDAISDAVLDGQTSKKTARHSGNRPKKHDRKPVEQVRCPRPEKVTGAVL